MSGFTVFLRKELVEIVRTWRGKVLLGVVLLFALTSAPLAQFTPELLKSFVPAGQQLSDLFPDPTFVDSYLQWVKNLEQIVMMTLIISSGGLIAGELVANTASMVLSKPLSRNAFIYAKFVGQVMLLFVTLAVGAAVCELMTITFFPESDVRSLVLATAAWFVFAVMMVSIMTLLSALLTPLAAGGLGVAVFFIISLGALWEPLVTYSPSGVSSLVSQLITGSTPESYWPLISSGMVAVAALFAAQVAFSRREI